MENKVTLPPKYHFNNLYYNSPLKCGDIYLIQIGRMYCDEHTEILSHVHTDFFELTVARAGKGKAFANGVGTPIKQGDIYVSLPKDAHRIVPDENEPLEYDFFSFYTDNAELASELGKIALYRGSPTERVFKDEKIGDLIANAINEFGEEKPFSKQLTEHIFMQIVIYMIRDLNNSRSTDKINKSRSDLLCYRLMNYIDTHVYSMKSLEELSEFTNYNYSYLSTLFKRTTKKTLADYYRDKKLETAKLLISEKRLKIGEIAEKLNYSTVYSFSKAFKEKYGFSPKNFGKKQ
ncbi:MAG TPA: hypothetical protein DDW54_00530 [Clostridiales bacterium]|nr:hypothetical protein [Clostridiales bacterium]